MATNYLLDQIIADLPISVRYQEGMLLLARVCETSYGVTADGLVSIHLVFREVEERNEFVKKYESCWIVTSDRCCKMNYVLTWTDVQGFGVQIGSYMPHRNGQDKKRRPSCLNQ